MCEITLNLKSKKASANWLSTFTLFINNGKMFEVMKKLRD